MAPVAIATGPMLIPGAPTSPRDRAVLAVSRLPPFSPVLTRLMGSLANEDVSFAELGDLVEKDPVLSGNVLRLVNSAFHSRRGAVSSVRHALSLLGTNKIRNVAMSLSVARMWSQERWAPGWDSTQFNLHGTAAAVLADLMAAEAGVPHAEAAFTSALLRDVGMLLVALELQDELGRVRELHQSTGRSLADCEREMIGIPHAALTIETLEQWRLPPTVIDSCAAADYAAPSSLRTVTAAAVQAVEQHGIALQPWVRRPEGTPEETLAAILPAKVCEDVLRRFQEEFEVLCAFFNC